MTGPTAIHRAVTIAVLVLLVGAAPAPAYIALPREPVPNKTAIADCVVVGKITAIRAQPVSAQLYRHLAEGKMEFVVADVAVEETLLGPKAAQVRIGFMAPRVKSGDYKPAPAVGQVGCFFAVKPGPMDFHVLPIGCFLDQQAEDYPQDLALARRCCRALAQPDEALKSKDPKDRLLAACMAVLRCTYAPLRWGGKLKGEPLDAGQSKLILQALAEADWNGVDAELKVSPSAVVGWLRAAANRTGSMAFSTFLPPGNGDAKDAAAQKAWLRAHAEDYRIERLVWADAPQTSSAPAQADTAPTTRPVTPP